MKTYIAILRGINVGGNRKLPMADLRASLARLGLQDVSTYIQSGNVIFKSAIVDLSILERDITQQIKTDYNYDVPVIVKDLDFWKQTLANNPFKENDPKKVVFTFLSQESNEVLPSFQSDHDTYELIGTVVHLYCPLGYGKSKLTNNFFEKKLKVNATTRNWNTVLKLYDLAKETL